MQEVISSTGIKKKKKKEKEEATRNSQWMRTVLALNRESVLAEWHDCCCTEGLNAVETYITLILLSETI